MKSLSKAAAPGTTSQALVVHARLLEFYDQIDLLRELDECESAPCRLSGVRPCVLRALAGGDGNRIQQVPKPHGRGEDIVGPMCHDPGMRRREFVAE